MEKKARQHQVQDLRVQKSTKGLKQDFAWHLRYALAKDEESATVRDKFMAFAYSVRDRIIEDWIETQTYYHEANVKRVYYLSLEFLIGRLLGNNVINMRIEPFCREAMEQYGLDWNAFRDLEVDAGLGNGGLGRLAACFLDSLSTLRLPAIGYGLRYDYGIFKQRVKDGQQVEEPDHWLNNESPWELARPEYTQEVQFGGQVECVSRNGRMEWTWKASECVIGVPYDWPIVGYSNVVNTLRLWSAKATDDFALEEFNKGSYVEAVQNKVQAENLTKVLYPNDNMQAGKELRLRQQYFFVACSLRDILRRFRVNNGCNWSLLPEKAFVHLNETHPTLIIPEMMHQLVDVEKMDWDTAWNITRACTGYTNHTILPEALETWSVALVERLLPRHMQIIYEINGRFLKQVALQYPGDIERLTRMSVISERGERSVRMAHLAIIGSNSVNGVAALHTDILKSTLFRDFYEMYPTHFSNKTNGITQRRWLLKANPQLAMLCTDTLGPDWITDLSRLRDLERHAKDPAFLDAFRAIKQANKEALASYIKYEVGITVNPESIFDVQVKRLHEYKRQLLLVLYIIILYNRICDNPALDFHPRTFIFAAKAAPGYWMAKLIIRLIHGVADVINTNPRVRDRLKVVFLPDYRVSLAEKIIPAANLSEQISLAGTEASGTGNMKLMLNGALTIGTMDGANVEIHEQVGNENIFIFGLRAEEVERLRPAYSSMAVYQADPEIRRAINMIRRNVFSLLNTGVFDPIVRNLLDFNDYYMLLADLRSYMDTQDKVDKLYRQPHKWDAKALVNVARSGKFSSDRTISEYAKYIWRLNPVDL
ncbi:MAG: glycogen/starch/alpha-glucan phosphorylase [Kiritimatiellaeota bacterium]|nr:glycogen/starch/alpha-glucan phosphorylase [Kiritimatiellota bacterium]